MGDDPAEDELVTLLLGVSGDISAVKEKISEIGGTVTEELPFHTLKIEISPKSISELQDIDLIESIERDEEGRIQGNPHSPQV